MLKSNDKSNSKKVPLNEINNELPKKFSYIGFASFEKRCLSLCKAIEKSRMKKVYILKNSDATANELCQARYAEIEKECHDISSIPVSLEKPAITTSNIVELIKQIQSDNEKRLVVDISTFTHEILAILIFVLFHFKEAFDELVFLYNGAVSYEPWLSKGCKEVRNVIGYPGRFRQNKRQHLIILTGFEHERATRLVEMLEPDKLSLGYGVDPTELTHSDTMSEKKKEFNSWIANIQGMDCITFDFSCTQIQKTINVLVKLIKEYRDYNNIIVPLNTKLSTIATALVGIMNDEVQICYPIPEVYNPAYSEPSENVTLIDMKLFFAKVK